MLTVERAGEPFEVPVAYAGQNVLAVDCDWATDTDAAFDADGRGRLLAPVEVGNREKIETGAKLARWLFAADEPPRYVLLLHGGVIVLADRLTWGEGRYLAVCPGRRAGTCRRRRTGADRRPVLRRRPAAPGRRRRGTPGRLRRRLPPARRRRLRRAARGPARVRADHRQRGPRPAPRAGRRRPGDIDDGNLAKDLGRQSLRYLYRILFLLYAEARPELGILPVDDEDYMAGYSMARLGDLVARRLGGEEARKSFHLYESLAVLFRMVNDGHRPAAARCGRRAVRGGGPAVRGAQGRPVRPGADQADRHGRPAAATTPTTGTRRATTPASATAALYRVLRRLMLSKGSGAGRGGRRGRTERGGFISYAQLGISQLGAVYEGLMSYTGFIADEDLYEVAKNGDPSGGSWMIPASKVPDYADEVFVKVKDENGFQTGERVRYRARLVRLPPGRPRPADQRLLLHPPVADLGHRPARPGAAGQGAGEREDGTKVTAAEVLRWRICEPALGSGAFLNEAIDQLAALYLRLREEETGDRLEPEERALALQRVKAYIALHNCYGVDLNETAVELAEVSIWLNVMHRGLQAPWFGLHLVRGNSLIGAGRRLYPAHALAKGEWLDDRPGRPPVLGGQDPVRPRPPLPAPRRGLGRGRGGEGGEGASPRAGEAAGDVAQAAPKAPSDKQDQGPQAHPGPAPAGPVGPRRVPVVPGHRAPAHLRTRDQPPDRRLGRGGPAAGRRKRSRATRSSPT